VTVCGRIFESPQRYNSDSHAKCRTIWYREVDEWCRFFGVSRGSMIPLVNFGWQRKRKRRECEQLLRHVRALVRGKERRDRGHSHLAFFSDPANSVNKAGSWPSPKVLPIKSIYKEDLSELPFMPCYSWQESEAQTQKLSEQELKKKSKKGVRFKPQHLAWIRHRYRQHHQSLLTSLCLPSDRGGGLKNICRISDYNWDIVPSFAPCATRVLFLFCCWLLLSGPKIADRDQKNRRAQAQLGAKAVPFLEGCSKEWLDGEIDVWHGQSAHSSLRSSLPACALHLKH